MLQHFLCREFGYPDTLAMLTRLDGVPPDTCNYRNSDYADALCLGAETSPAVTPDQMIEYDRRLSAHSAALRRSADGDRLWTPPLYLALLFTERYLDRYFSDAEELRGDLNRFRCENPDARSLPEYSRDDLRGITAHSDIGDDASHLAHFHVLQYRHWAEQAGVRLNNILLLAPDQDAIAQHERNLAAGQVRARIFHPNAGTPLHPTVDLIELRQFGPATDFDQPLRASEFGLNVLVLADEWHLDAPAKKIWHKLRTEFLLQGFVCEYCSSFRHAAGRDQELRDRYEKCLLLDFPWRWHQAAGYGKNAVLMDTPAEM